LNVSSEFSPKISPLPNILSAMRIFLSPFVFFSIKSDNIPLIFALAITAIISDFLDGYFARKLNSISKTGKILDPLADKLLVGVAAIALTIYGDLPVLLLVLILTRDFIIAMVGLMIIKKENVIPVSNVLGKITVNVFSIVLIVYVLRLNIFYEFAFWFAVIFLVISSASYLVYSLKIFVFKTGINQLDN